MRKLVNPRIYLDRLAKPLAEKLKIVKFIPENSKRIVDVGCADGTVTRELAKMFPDICFLGIDLNEEFIEIAKSKSSNIKNLKFEKIYLRQLLARPERFTAVIFCSVLHEFYTYGEGISSVLKAVADAHELIDKDGVIIIRDMILDEYTKRTTFQIAGIVKKIARKKELIPCIKDFEEYFGKLNSVYKVNHFLLKYWYSENWERESKEHYVSVTFEEYEKIFSLLGMTIQYKDSYLIPYLANKWKNDFDLTEDEISGLRSTGIIVSQK